MATANQLAVQTPTASPIAYWHLLSLDAPTVAALWTWFVAGVSNIRLPTATLAAVYLGVWIVYAADRLLDARALDGPRRGTMRCDELEARHLFHHRHRRAFMAWIAAAAALLLAVLPRLAPAAVHLYVVEAALLAAWFLILHATSSTRLLPKEIAVGVFFSAAIFVPTLAGTPVAIGPDPRAAMLPVALLFGALCSLNCLCIHVWEHEGQGHGGRQHGAPALRDRPAHGSTRLAAAHLPALARAMAVCGTALAAFDLLAAHHPRRAQLPAACALAAVLLLALDRNRHELSRLDLRAAVDLALLTPVLFLPILR